MIHSTTNPCSCHSKFNGAVRVQGRLLTRLSGGVTGKGNGRTLTLLSTSCHSSHKMQVLDTILTLKTASSGLTIHPSRVNENNHYHQTKPSG